MQNLDYVCNKFRVEVNESLRTISILNSKNLKPKYLEHIAEHSFLYSYTRWEIFLETSFMLYLLGQKPVHGKGARPYVKVKKLKEGYRFIASKWSNKYEKWDHEEVQRREDLFFSPTFRFYYNAFKQIKPELDDMKIIRNNIAHNNKETRRSFESLFRSKLGTLPVNQKITPGNLLLKIKPKTSDTFLTYYTDALLAASKIIVPP